MEGADDEDAKSESEAEFKQVFSVPARVTGRLEAQLAAVLAAAGDVVKRHEDLLPMRKEQGRSFSPERWAQIEALHDTTKALLSARVTEAKADARREAPDARNSTGDRRPATGDTPLLSLQAAVEAERLKLLIACGGA